MSETNEVMVTEGGEVATYDASDVGGGLEEIGTQDTKPQYMKLAQSGSPELKKAKAEFIEGLEEGDFFNAGTRRNYGNQVDAVIVQIQPRIVEWEPSEGGQSRFVHAFKPSETPNDYHIGDSGNRKRVMIRPGGTILEPTYYYWMLVPTEDSLDAVIYSFSRTSVNDAKRFQTQFKAMKIKAGPMAGKERPVFSHKVRLFSVPKESNAYSWMGVNLKIVGEVLPNDQMYQMAKAALAQYKDLAAPIVSVNSGTEEVIVDDKVVNETI